MHPLILLPLATFILLIAYLGWNWYSTKQNLETGGDTKGKRQPIAVLCRRA